MSGAAGKIPQPGTQSPTPTTGPGTTQTTIAPGTDNTGPGVAVEYGRDPDPWRLPETRGLVAVGATRGACSPRAVAATRRSTYKEPTGPAVATVSLEAGNTYFKPDKVTASPPGIIEIKVKNVESGIHDLVIRDIPGFQVEVSGEGDVASGKVKLAKGKYEFYCTIPGHEEAGMKGTLTVS